MSRVMLDTVNPWTEKEAYVEVSFDACVDLMEDDLREKVVAMGLQTDQQFLDAYCELHLEAFAQHFWI